MIPDLGKYAVEVLAAYGVSLILLIGIVAITLRRSRRVKSRLSEVEARRTRHKVDAP